MINRLCQAAALAFSFTAFFNLSAYAAPSATVTSVVPAQGATVSGNVTVASNGTISLSPGDPTTKFGITTGAYRSGKICSAYQEMFVSAGPPTTYTQFAVFDSTQVPNSNGALNYQASAGIESITGTPPNLQYTILSTLTNYFAVQNSTGHY